MTDSVTLLGVKGGPAIRPGSHMPTGILLRLAGRAILVDAGLGVARSVCDAGVPLPALERIFVTHLHSDHYLELGPLLHTAWTAGRTAPVPVCGPTGLSGYWDGFTASMAFDIELREADEGRVPFAPLAALSVIAPGVVYEDDGLRVIAMKNDHPPIEESFALRIETSERTVVLSGDTAPMAEMVDFARGADLLVHEAMLIPGVEALVAKMPNGDARLRTHILRSHTAAEDVGRIALKAGVGHLAVNHFVPDGDPDFPEGMWEEAIRNQWRGPLTLGRDGVTISL